MPRYKIEIEGDLSQLATALAALKPLVNVVGHQEFSLATEEEIERARALYAASDGADIEIDDDAGTSKAHDGVWVQAWVWVEHEYCNYDDCDEEAEPKWEAGYE